MRLWTELTRHELVIALKTKRALAVSLVYILAATLGALGYAFALGKMEETALAALTESGLDPIRAAAALSLTSESAYVEMVAFFAGAPSEELASTIKNSAAVPVYFWASLTFLPFLVGLTSFDAIQNDLSNRTLCYSTLRASRRVLLLSKFTAHLLMLTAVSGLAALSFLLMTAFMVESVSALDTMPGMLRVWICLVPFGAAYLALSTMVSTMTKRAAAALALSVTAVVVLRVFYWLGAIPESSAYAPLRVFRYVSPVLFHDDLWRSGIIAPFGAVLVFGLYAIVFLFLADRRLEARDL